MKKGRKSGAVWMFLGGLLIVFFAVGLAVEQNPGILIRQYRYDRALELFGAFCASVWLPAGIIGIPMFLISLIVSLIRERKEGREE